MKISKRAWVVWFATLACWAISAAVNEYAVRSEIDALIAEHRAVVEEKSDLQLKVYDLEKEVLNLKAQLPK